jgi:hypothetical protein
MLIRSRNRDRSRGGSVALSSLATGYLNGVTPYHWLDFITNRMLYAGADVGNVTQATGYSFTRASDGYYTNSDGTLTSFASGALRRGDRGVLIEGSRTNLVLQSQTFGTFPWVRQILGDGVLPTLTPNYALAPDGTMTATRLQCSRATATLSSRSRIEQNVTYALGSLTRSVYIKSTDGSPQDIQVQDSSENNSINTVTVGADWQRVTLTYTAILGTSGNFWIGLLNASTTALTSDVLIWGAQLETASFPSSYIPTVAASATRAADVLTYTAGVTYPLSMWVEFERAVDTGGLEAIIAIDNGTTGKRFNLRVATNDRAEATAVAGGATQATDNISGSLLVGTVYKFAGRLNTNSMQIARGGTLGSEDTLVTLPTTPTVLSVGLRNSSEPLFGYIRRAAIFNSALTDAQLQTVTT